VLITAVATGKVAIIVVVCVISAVLFVVRMNLIRTR